MTPDPTSNTHAQLAEYLRLNPDTTAIEAVGHVGADPARWVDVVEDALGTADPAETLSDTKPPEDTGADADPNRSNPGGDADASRSGTPEPTDGEEFNQHTDPEDGGVLVNDPSGWTGADFATTESDTYPPELLDRERWMGRKGKLPFAPWGDTDPEDADPEDSPRWEWGRTENYVTGDTIDLAEDDPRLDGRVFLQQEADPFAFVDGDDVRDPETGEVHPAFIAILEHLGLTYADVSTSGAGVHAITSRRTDSRSMERDRRYLILTPSRGGRTTPRRPSRYTQISTFALPRASTFAGRRSTLPSGTPTRSGGSSRQTGTTTKSPYHMTPTGTAPSWTDTTRTRSAPRTPPRTSGTC